MKQGKKLIECELITGGKKAVPADQLLFRPAAYGIITKGAQVLLVNTKSTGRWFFPGGAVERGEKIEDALKREVQEETGLLLKDISFFAFKESFFYYEPHKQGYHCFNIFFTAIPQEGASAAQVKNDPTDEANRHEWLDIASVQLSDMQSFGAEILEKFQTS
ncbi:MAG: NUDIX domain-containing protein [Candidatus Komeilibacteria bacterium]|nr:NUDIX domain-containing protein [Candidatus Komeilibacteria bacterium]